MRLRILILIWTLLGLFGLASCGQRDLFSRGSWVVVNTASGAGAIAALTIPATGMGNLIAVGLMFNGGTYVTSISDDAGNVYVSAGAKAFVGGYSSEIWYAVNSRSGATLVTPTFAGSPTQVELTVWETSGISSSAPDTTSTSSGRVTLDNIPGAAVTTTETSDFIVSILFAIDTDVSGMSTGSGFTNDFTTEGNGWAHITSNSVPVGTYQASWVTSSPEGVYCASSAAFRTSGM
jgi:hypothetical protein